MKSRDIPHSTFYAQRIESMPEYAGEKISLHRQSSHLICFVQEGSGSVIIGRHLFPIANYSLFVVPSHMAYSIDLSDSAASGFIVRFTTELFINKAFPRRLVEDKMILFGALRPHVLLDGAQSLSITRVMEQLIYEYDNGAAAIRSEEMVCIKVLELLLLCERLSREKNSRHAVPAVPGEVILFQQMLEHEFRRHHSVRYYAKRQGVHPNTLNAYVRQYCGLPVKALINRKLTREAKYLLSLGDLSVKEIAMQLGFGDANYFSYFFKTEAGVSPLEYRHGKSDGRSGR